MNIPKQFLLITSVLLILFTCGTVPARVHAAKQTENPESWLWDEEKAFVARIRATDSAIREVSADLDQLLWNYTLDKNTLIRADLTFLRDMLMRFCDPMQIPMEFSSIGQNYCHMAKHFTDRNRYGLSPENYGFSDLSTQALPEIVYLLTATKRELRALEADLNRLDRKLAAKIADVAQTRKMATEILEKIYGKCCVVATATYGTEAAEGINILRRFRNEAMISNSMGRAFVELYYRHSPPLAELVSEREWLRTLVRQCLVTPTVCLVEATEKWWDR